MFQNIRKWLLQKLNGVPKEEVVLDHSLLTYYLLGIDFSNIYPNIKVETTKISFLQKNYEEEKEVIVKFLGNTHKKVKINSITIKD